MDYAEEQRSELEALEAIYPSEFTVLSEAPITFTIVSKTTDFEETGEGYTALLKFTLTPKYPEEIPQIEIVPSEEDEEQTNLEPEESDELCNHLLQQCHCVIEAGGPFYNNWIRGYKRFREGLLSLRPRLFSFSELPTILIVCFAEENTGMAMIFTLVSVALEWLNERWDSSVKEKEEEDERKRIQQEEEEQKRFEGTRVTIQTFIEWKTKFDAEMSMKKKELEAKEKDTSNKKLTGKELFMCDKTLNDSDLTFDEGDDAVPIDESLFEDLEDLDIDDDDDPED